MDASPRSNSMIVRPFFGEELYPPLIPKEKTYWNYLPSWRCMKITAIGGGVTFGGAMIYIAADCIRVMIETSPSDFEFTYNATLLGLDTLTLGGAACISLAVYGFFRWGKNRVLQRIPHLMHYQVSLITPIRYLDLRKSVQDRNFCTPLISACFEELEERGLLEAWLNCKKFENLEQATESMFKKLNKGLCYGYTMALLAMMLTDYDSSSQELVDKLDLQKIVYFQMMHLIIHDFMNHDWHSFADVFPLEKSLGMKYSDNEATIISSTFWLLALLNLDSHKIIIHQSSNANISEMKAGNLEEFFNEHFNKMEEMQKALPLEGTKGWTVAGEISLYENKKPENEEDKSNKLKAHALFFQFSENHYRFHDSGYAVAGFYQFDSKEVFFENLLVHIKTWPVFKDGGLKVTVLGIPQENQTEASASTFS